MIHGRVGPSGGSYAPPPPPPGYAPPPPPGPPDVAPQRSTAVATCRPETRALVALSYPFWPLALLALLDSRGSHFVKRQAWQALGFNFGMYGLGALLSAVAAIPVLGLGAMPLLPFIIPVTVVASVVYSFRVWQGDDVSVPVVSDWVDARLPPQNQNA
ncbi:MAG: hypothetical protein NVS3B7_03010 [Candidatus Elarobacter sp.]